jgi:hypothetical protein
MNFDWKSNHGTTGLSSVEVIEVMNASDSNLEHQLELLYHLCINMCLL